MITGCAAHTYITVAPLHEYVMKSTEIRRMEFYIVLPSPSSSFSLSVLLAHPLSSPPFLLLVGGLKLLNI